MSEKKPPPDPLSFDPFAMWRDWFARSEQQWSQGLSEMLKDERVAGALGKEAQKAMLMQKMFAEASERYLAYLNLPSRTDLEKLGERLGRVEDSLAALQAEIVQLRTALSGAGPATPHRASRPPRTRKPAGA